MNALVIVKHLLEDEESPEEFLKGDFLKKPSIGVLDAFTAGFLEEALWETHDDLSGYARNLTLDDYEKIDASSLITIETDCFNFQKEAAHLLTLATESAPAYDTSNAGRDFYRTRNNKPDGYFNKGPQPHWHELYLLARRYGKLELFVLGNGSIAAYS